MDEPLNVLFQTIDKDKTGEISLSSFQAAISIFNWKITPDQLALGFPDSDQKLTLKQFQTFMVSLQDSVYRVPLQQLVDRLILNSSLEIVISRTIKVRSKLGFLCDMDGVVYRGGRLIPGISRFLNWVRKTNKKLLFVTNTSCLTQKQLQAKVKKIGLEVEPEMFFTAALATADFLAMQKPTGCTAFIIGDAGLREALEEKGISITDHNPDYVVIGECTAITNHMINTATNLVHKGAKLIGCNIDSFDPIEDGIMPSCGAWASVVEVATGKKAYFCGKPNPFLMRAALQRLDCHSQDVSMIGDRMDTDVVAGLESGLEPILVLSGVTNKTNIENYAYRPFLVVNDVGDIAPPEF